MQQHFFCVELSRVLANDEDLVSHLCFELGAAGVSEDLSYKQENDIYLPQILETEYKKLFVYFEDRPAEEFFLQMKENYPDIGVLAEKKKNQDWLEEWKKGYKPFHLAGDYWVVPTWEEKPTEAKKSIFIDPGMAFGTGTHSTTQIAAEIICDLLAESSSEEKINSVLDVGTGTGILAFLSEMEGVSRVVATEIDDDARRVARENQENNKLKKLEVLEEQIEKVGDSFDLVIANIIDGVLLQLRKDLIRCVKKGGFLVLTGILQEREEKFVRDFFNSSLASESKLKILRREEKDEWVGFLVGVP